MTTAPHATTPVSLVRAPRPQETPECESSTCAGISVHDPVYEHDSWWNWIGVGAVALIAVFAAGFMIARIVTS
ncbi:hypothetical protein GXW83_17010 [Streptacidiphilus sp. PB12-B1b]|uniref:hypothetical protein n=1 Tax=Streptacidiphilus sp. PB12-B1b TaxID=2705012 RepID=UPI0015FB20DF|nr:hypothetical protein [Streptacidiphilus sp. PB12-B1b]QMU77156.1 hypothetical protein GXW83_17010 [Streptacidiphilus sp. PB12-B1b]